MTLHDIPNEVTHPILPEIWNLGLQAIISVYEEARFRINISQQTMEWVLSPPHGLWSYFPLNTGNNTFGNMEDWVADFNTQHIPFTDWDRVEVIG